MTGYIASTSGEVLIDGHNILEEPEAAKKMHRIPAGTASAVLRYDGS
mgnify:FL=1